jgi:arylsulfatase A-like enzyme
VIVSQRSGGAPRATIRLVLLVALQVCAGSGCAPEERPSVLLVTIDTLRPDRLSVYGYRRQRTPSIDALARDGALFEHAVCDVPWTSGSMASVLTGRYATHHGIRLGVDRLADEAVTLAEVVRDHGWRTAAVIGSFPLASVYNLSQGFETYDERLDTPMVPFLPEMKPKFDVKPVPTLKLDDPSTFASYFADKMFNDAFRTDDAVTNAAARWLDEHRDAPFFLWVHYFGPHERVALKETAEQAGARAVAQYDRDLAFTDRQVGRLFDYLDTFGLRERVLVILHADHGQSLGENDYVGHGLNLYQATLRIPLIMRWPGRIPAGVRVRGWVENVDIFPTVLHALGISAPVPLDGFDLLGFLRHAAPGVQQIGTRRPAYSETFVPSVTPQDVNVADRGTVTARPAHRGLLAGNRMYVATELFPPCAAKDGSAVSDDACRALGAEVLFDPLADPEGRRDLTRAEPSTLAHRRAEIALYRAMVHIAGENAPLDEEARRKLRALGYAW